MKDDLKDRVLQFNTLSLPDQPPMMHMGTSYLVSDLVEEIRRLETEIEALREVLIAIRDRKSPWAFELQDMAKNAINAERGKK